MVYLLNNYDYFLLVVPTTGRQGGEDPDVAMEGALGEVEGAAQPRVLRQVARAVLLALQLDIGIAGL